jgi:hypothetical protein
MLVELAKKYDVDMLELGYLEHYEKRFDDIRLDVKKTVQFYSKETNKMLLI